MTTRFKVSAIGLTLAVFTSLTGADGGCGQPPILDNNGFDLWCGDELCFWDVEAGQIEKAPTWHNTDFGVRFIGPIAAISQVSNIGSETNCLQFRAVANVELGVTVTVEVDYFNDDSYEVSQTIPTSDWARIEFELPTPTSFRLAKFRVRKQGPGEAVLAEVQVNRSDKCNAPDVIINERENGQVCFENEDCASNLCSSILFGDRVCIECEDSDDCPGAEACGIRDPGDPEQSLALECGAAGRHELGEICATDEECSTGICFGGICSTCTTDPDTSCGDQCQQVSFGPFMCGGDDAMLDPGAVCFADSQCISGDCQGPDSKMCTDDGRTCDGEEDCPVESTCATVGVADGICQ